MQDYGQAFAFIAALTGIDPSVAVIEWRAIHDTNKGVAGIPIRGTLADTWSQLLAYQAVGYGIFANINAMDGKGLHLENVAHIRAHAVDLDNISAPVNYARALDWQPVPSFAVSSSNNKYHVYWCVNPYVSNDYASNIQRKLRQFFDGDKSVTDPSRVMRVPGTLHLKNPSQPALVTFIPLSYARHQVETLAAALEHVNVIDGSGERHALGDPDLAAPSLDWVVFAMASCDPNTLDRAEWVSITAAIKQSAWSLTDPDTIYAMWSDWCSKYNTTDPSGKPIVNDPAENLKLWNSIRNSETGWKTLVNRIPTLKAHLTFGGKDRTLAPPPETPNVIQVTTSNFDIPQNQKVGGEILNETEQAELFKNCVFVRNIGLMFNSDGRFMNQSTFNVTYGGYRFIIDRVGKVSDEAWKAATRSTLWTVPQVDHTRFVPSETFGKVIYDDLQRSGINTYKPFSPFRKEGDISPFLRHMSLLFPDPNDRQILFAYLAHNAKYPGFKIPWAPFIQSTPGAGKGFLGHVMSYVMGGHYTYRPKAKDLAASGSTFNAWMRNKLFIICDEIKVDDTYELMETLKPMISEELIEVQAKGVDQELEDNFSNWMFFSNFRKGMPINPDERRVAPFFTPFQHKTDLLASQMHESYFTQLYDWQKREGNAIIAHWLLNYPIERGAIPMTAPHTSSTDEAIRIGRGPIERYIIEGVEDAAQGFRNGWVSTIAVGKRLKAMGMRQQSTMVIETILGNMGYYHIGRAVKTYFAENSEVRATLFAIHPNMNPADYGAAQGYGE